MARLKNNIMKKGLFIIGFLIVFLGNAQIGSISNGESGSSVRAKLNAIIDSVNVLDTLWDISNLAKTDGNFIVGNGSNWVAESGATARASLGLGSSDAVTFGSVTIDDIFDNGSGLLIDGGGGDGITLNQAAYLTIETTDYLLLQADSIDVDSKKVTSLADPINPSDATNKSYVDALVIGSGGGNVTTAGLSNNQIAVSSGANAIDSDANFTWDGSTHGITGDLDVDNININANTISSTDTDGDITLSPDGAGEEDIQSAVTATGDGSFSGIELTTGGTVKTILPDVENFSVVLKGGSGVGNSSIILFGKSHASGDGISLSSESGPQLTIEDGIVEVQEVLNVIEGASFGLGTTGDLTVDISNESIADDESRVFRAIATHNSNTTQAQLGVTTHSGITNAVGYLRLDAEDQAQRYIWVDNSNDVRTAAASIANLGTTSGTVVGTQTSDIRLKTTMPFTYGLNDILQLEPIKYIRNDDAHATERIGFSAQQVREILPETVYDTNEEIEGFEGEATKLAMRYEDIIPVLVQAIKELEARIQELENQ